jgi:hypothetical protein
LKKKSLILKWILHFRERQLFEFYQNLIFLLNNIRPYMYNYQYNFLFHTFHTAKYDQWTFSVWTTWCFNRNHYWNQSYQFRLVSISKISISKPISTWNNKVLFRCYKNGCLKQRNHYTLLRTILILLHSYNKGSTAVYSSKRIQFCTQ